MTAVAVNVYSHTHSVTYVAENILKSMKDIIRLSGLDRAEFVKDGDLHRQPQRQHVLPEEDLMLTTNEAFRKFKSKLELNQREEDNARSREQEVREYLDSKFSIVNDFLTGSYARWTKTKPLKDVAIFFVLNPDKHDYRSKAPSVVLGDFHDVLVDKYGAKAVKKQGRSINIDFGVQVDAA